MQLSESFAKDIKRPLIMHFSETGFSLEKYC